MYTRNASHIGRYSLISDKVIPHPTGGSVALSRVHISVIGAYVFLTQSCNYNNSRELEDKTCINYITVKREQIDNYSAYNFKKISFSTCEKKTELIYSLNGWQLTDSIAYEKKDNGILGQYYFCKYDNGSIIKELRYTDTVQNHNWSEDFLTNVAISDNLSRFSSVVDKSKNNGSKALLNECISSYTEFGVPALNNAKHIQLWLKDVGKTQKVEVVFNKGLFTQSFTKKNESKVTVRSVYLNTETKASIVTIDTYSGSFK
jgi:hypothetical protein